MATPPSRHPSPRPGALQDADALADRRRRAIEEPLDVRAIESSPHLRLRVRNPIHGTSYEVHVPEYPDRAGAVCTCPDFSRRGIGTCKHLEAVWIALASGELPTNAGPRADLPEPSTLWASIDRALERSTVPPLSPSRLRISGEPLLRGRPAPAAEAPAGRRRRR